MDVAAKGCHIRHLIDLDQRSTVELRTALYIAVQQSNVGITRLLLESGAKDEWKDFLGMHARHYVRDDAIGVLFLQRKKLKDPLKTHPRSSPYDNYQQNKQESTKRHQAPFTASTSNTAVFPSKKGKFSSTTKRKGEACSNIVRQRIAIQRTPTEYISPDNISLGAIWITKHNTNRKNHRYRNERAASPRIYNPQSAWIYQPSFSMIQD
jgi:hypothetical protein